MFYTEQITFTKHLETLPLTKLEFPLHIWNAFSLSFKYPHFGGLGEKLHINKLDYSKYKESSEESSLPRLRGRLLQSCRAHCLSSKAQTCCGQPVLPLVFLSLLLTVLFKISFWGDRIRGEREKQKGERREKKVRYIPPLSRSHLLCFEIGNYEETRAHGGLRTSRDIRGTCTAPRRGRSRRPWRVNSRSVPPCCSAAARARGWRLRSASHPRGLRYGLP